ncbi:MAG TPA: carboxypeptidase-like regulatory domain-containing protein, partial [Vicinamibacteria bacterium]|nr:carboxypeptidase-like regulatory domain-containing protein [Vicinamibacteria bacterium]
GRVTYPGRQVIVPDADGFTADFAFAGVAVSGQVVDEAGTPVAGQVTANRLATEGSGRTTAMVGRDGRFTLELEPGEYMIGPHAEGYVGTGTRVTIGEGDLDNVRLLVTRGGEISGRVVDAQGRGAGGIQVHAFPDDGPPRPGGPGTFGSARALLDGRFTITGLSDRRYVLTAGDAESGFGAAPDVAVGTRDALLRLAPGGRVRARVVASDGSPAPLAMAFVRQVDGRPFFGGRPEQTDAQGMAELAVPAGTIVVSAGNASGTGSATVAVTAGETAVVEIRLEGRPPGRGTR